MSSEPECRLDEYAEKIRAIGKRAISDVIEVGRLLTEAKEIAGHGHWLPWLRQNFGWSDETARKWMHAYEASLKFQSNWNLDQLQLRDLYLLTKATPKALDLIAEKVEHGESLPSAVQKHDAAKLH
jgi:hypothetical protein